MRNVTVYAAAFGTASRISIRAIACYTVTSRNAEFKVTQFQDYDITNLGSVKQINNLKYSVYGMRPEILFVGMEAH
jgi:hypothetical protein